MSGLLRLAIAAGATLIAAERLHTWLTSRHPRGNESMFDCAKELTQFHDQSVRLPQTTRDTLRNHRQINQRRLRNGLASSDNPPVIKFVKQGSYAMHTINQHPQNDYDIDDGAAFYAEDLVGSRGAEMSSLQARQMVRNAIDDGSFKRAPEVRPNCVRVYYQAGHHVDVPVYRICTDEFDENETFLELASAGGWIKSDPRRVTIWFNNSVATKSPDAVNGQQMRRITRLVKVFAKSRDSWNSPSGIILSVLVDESYESANNRDDLALYNTMRRIHSRLQDDLTVSHPVLDENLTKTDEDACMRDFRKRLQQALDDLGVLHDADNCTREVALKSWGRVFNHPFFDEKIEAAGGS